MAAKKQTPATVAVRILVDTEIEGNRHACNSVAEFSYSLAAELVRDGVADDNAEAVKAAK